MNYKTSGVRTLIALMSTAALMSIATGCSQTISSSKPVAITPSPGAAPGDYTAQLRASSTAIQSAQRK